MKITKHPDQQTLSYTLNKTISAKEYDSFQTIIAIQKEEFVPEETPSLGRVEISLTPREAAYLRWICGTIGGYGYDSIRKVSNHLYKELREYDEVLSKQPEKEEEGRLMIKSHPDFKDYDPEE